MRMPERIMRPPPSPMPSRGRRTQTRRLLDTHLRQLLRGDACTCGGRGGRGGRERRSPAPCRRSGTPRGRRNGSQPCGGARLWGTHLVTEISRGDRARLRARRSAGRRPPGCRGARMPGSPADRAGRGEEPEPRASPAGLAKRGDECLEGDAAVSFANIVLGGCKEVVEPEARLVTFVGRRAQDDEIILA